MRLLAAPLALVALAALSLPAAALAAPQLQALSGWQAGRWQNHSDTGTAAAICLDRPDTLLLAGHPDAGCQFSTIADQPDRSAITYQCSGGRQGRTDLRRDTSDLYRVMAQGLAGGQPFASRSEWRRLGPCTGAPAR